MASSLPDVAIPESASHSVRTVMRFMQRWHALIWDDVQELDAAQMDWKPGKEADSIGLIVDHLIFTEQTLLEGDLLHQPSTPVSELPQQAYKWGREMAQRSGVPGSAYLPDFGEAYRRLMEYIASLSDEDLQRITLLWDGERRQPVHDRLEILLLHLAYHRGQIVYITLLDDFPVAA